MRQERAENGTFKPIYKNAGDTVVMRVPKTYQKLIRELLLVLDEAESHSIDSGDILSEIIESVTDRISQATN